MIDTLIKTKDLPDDKLKQLLETDQYDNLLYQAADKKRREIYGNNIYIRGLIEISNYCKNNCYYCGIRWENKNISRYRLTLEDILSCCEKGYNLGFRTFVLQGGEDPYFTDEIICLIVGSIRQRYKDCAITLSFGERSRESYEKFFKAGANRYLLRHETAQNEHYLKLHPKEMSSENRKKCLFDLKEIGFQTGSGFLVGSPFQTTENIIEDIRFLKKLQPQMIGIGPFLSQKDTPFKDFENGDFKLTLRLISILRLMFPYALIPSTTALGTLNKKGRIMGIKAGANVVMPNLSPLDTRKLYALYDNKISLGEEAAESVEKLRISMKKEGFNIVVDRGDAKNS